MKTPTNSTGISRRAAGVPGDAVTADITTPIRALAYGARAAAL
jgi:hypothetical protein